MKLETIIESIKRAIADEAGLTEDYHKGRVSAFRHVLSMLEGTNFKASNRHVQDTKE